MGVADEVARAKQALAQGDTATALCACQAALQMDGNSRDAHLTLGDIYTMLKNGVMAEHSYESAIRIDKEHFYAYSKIGQLYLDQGNLNAAERYLQMAISRHRESPETLMALAEVLRQKKEFIAAADNCHRAYNACRGSGDLLNPLIMLGRIFIEMGDPSKAVAVYKRAIELYPSRTEGYIGLSHALEQSGAGDKAHQEFMRIFQESTVEHTAATKDRAGCLCLHMGRPDEAIRHLTEAIEIQPDFAPAYNNLGTAHKARGALSDAVTCYLKAIELDPTYAEPYSNLGNVLKQGGDSRKALQYYTKALQLNPAFFDAHMNVGHLYKDHGRFVLAFEHYNAAADLKSTSQDAAADAFCHMFHTELCLGKWDRYALHSDRLRSVIDSQLRRVSVDPTRAPLPAVQPFHALPMPLEDVQTREISRAYGAWTARAAAALRPGKPFAFDHLCQGTGPVHIGYVSSDFTDHPMGHLLGAVCTIHDRTRVTVTCYSLAPVDDTGVQARERLVAAADNFRDVAGWTPQDIAAAIYNDGVHVLVNLNGYTRGAKNEVFAMRPAPVSVSLMGFPNTTGAEFIDYLVTDTVASPPDLGYLYSEALIYMPHCYFATNYRDHGEIFTATELEEAAVHTGASRSELRVQFGVPEDAFVLACFNQVYKMDPEMFTLWIRLLLTHPNTVLVLLRFPSEAEPQLRDSAAALGLEDGSRLIFLDTLPKAAHVRRGLMVDLFLDTHQCNGHTTVADTLWAGTPVVTRPANTMASRVATSMVTHLGVGEELTALSPDHYTSIASHLITDPEYYADVRRRLTAARDGLGLFDTEGWVRGWEAAVEMVYSQWRLGGRPVTFEVTL